MQSTARENINIPAYGNVEHQGTAIVSEISIKWGRPPIFRESLRPRATIDRLGHENALVVVRAAHVVAAAPANQLAAAAFQAGRAIRTPQTHVLGIAIVSRLDKLSFGSGSRRHEGEPISLPVADSSGIDTHLIECDFRQNHRR